MIAAAAGAALLFGGAARAVQVDCPLSPCAIPAPHFVNVYWGMQQTVSAPGGTDPFSITSDRVEAFTGALVNSDYFLGAVQYGVTPPYTIGPSVFVTPASNPCPDRKSFPAQSHARSHSRAARRFREAPSCAAVGDSQRHDSHRHCRPRQPARVG